MNTENLCRYLNNHLAGAKAALDLIQALIDRPEEEAGREFFLDLHSQVQSDHEVLMSLIEDFGFDESSMTGVAGKLTGFASRIKLMWDGWDSGDLGLLEAYELLVLGITGKRLLWISLDQIKARLPELDSYDFAHLKERAIQQAAAVEQRREREARRALILNEVP